ncbi:MAG TPA: hypothetical protein VEJ84_06665 [Acidimicrobiales bacterium]|nr:hypothetical protein [Acidimicrobiales bacterium]
MITPGANGLPEEGPSTVRSKSTAIRGAKVLLGACLAVAVTSMAASPVWAKGRRIATTSTTTSTSTTTTTVGTMPVPAPPAPALPDNCGKGAWPSVVQGRPLSFQAGDGVYLWDDPDGGWALRVTHTGPSDDAVISGTLTTSGKFLDVRRMQNGDGDDIVVVGAAKHTILFRFVNYGWLDGLDFATRCSPAFTASFYIGGALASTSAVHLGEGAVSPTGNPFRVERARDAIVSGVRTVSVTTTSVEALPSSPSRASLTA